MLGLVGHLPVSEVLVLIGCLPSRSLSELDSLRLTGEAGDKIRQVTERATLFRITSNAMINVSVTPPHTHTHTHSTVLVTLDKTAWDRSERLLLQVQVSLAVSTAIKCHSCIMYRCNVPSNSLSPKTGVSRVIELSTMFR